MPPLPSITIPGPFIVIGILAIVILIAAGTLVSALRNRSNAGNPWGRAISVAREHQRQQTAQMDELHRAVVELSAHNSKPNKPNE